MLFRSDRKSTRLNSSHTIISYAVFCLKKKATKREGRFKPHASYTSSTLTGNRGGRWRTPASETLSPLTGNADGLNGLIFFFFNDPAPPEINPLPLHDALPI